MAYVEQVLNDREKKTNKLNEMKEVLENSRRQLQVVRHQTHILYKGMLRV